MSADASPQTVSQNGHLPAPASCGPTFALGWLMAQLYGPLPVATDPAPADRLPTLTELDTEARLDLAFAELANQLGKAGLGQLDCTPVGDGWRSGGIPDLQAALRTLHLDILGRLVCDDEHRAASYQLGRALHDACWVPDTDHAIPGGKHRVDAFLDQFSRERLGSLQTWLGQMSAIAPNAAAVAGRSLQNWHDWADANATTLRRQWGSSEAPIVAALRTQSTVWHRLLSDEGGLTSQPPIGAWIQAGEAMLRSTHAIVRKILTRFWLVGVAILAATGGLLALAISTTSGTARVWSSLVTVVGGFGVSGASLRAGAKRVASGIEQSVWQAATLDARAWTVTWLPPLQQGPVRRHRLNQKGVALPATTRRAKPPA